MKDTPTLISNCPQENLSGEILPVTQQYYLIIMANADIGKDTGVAMEYRHLKKYQHTNQSG